LSGINWENRIDVLFHIGANNDTLDMDRESMFRSNVEEPKLLFQQCLDQGCKQFVYASSTAVYGDLPAPHKEDMALKPLNPYAESKAVFEEWATDWAKRNNVNCVGLRYCNVYGPGEEHKGRRASMIYQLFLQMMAGNRPRLFTGGEQKRDWIWVADVVDANLRAMAFQGVDVFNCGTGSPCTFNDLVRAVNQVMKTSLEPEYIDNPAAAAYQSHTECDMDKIKQAMNFRPLVGTIDGIRLYYEYLRKRK
jgi:ADP-L-glycero-D-manno-heptose 6-epimerase